jgi:hypothetical protein
VRRLGVSAALIGAVVAVAAWVGVVANAGGSSLFTSGNLVVSRSVYGGDAGTVQVGMTLPPGCTSGCVSAVADGSYPEVFNNDLVDSSFGITSKIFFDQLTPSGAHVNSLEVPNSTQNGVPPTKDQMVTSFSSKSEVALNLSTDGHDLSFMGYLAPVNAIDVSNSNTPGIVDPTNPVPSSYYRVVGQVDGKGKFQFTKTAAYSGNNGRAAVLNAAGNAVYTAGNAGNGSDPQPDGIIIGAGAQILGPQVKALVAQNPGDPTPVASFNISQLGDKPDKIGKDTNFRGMTIFDNVLYYTKGSGGNGVNTVYFVDTTGKACPSSSATPGIGLPQSGAALPTSPIAYDPSLLQGEGVTPTNMCILNGFPTALKSKTSFPFGIWFASPTVLYVADEGNGDNTYSPAGGSYTKAAAQTTAGLQKWVLSGGSWHLAYTLQNGLQLGQPYTISGYPTGNNGDGKGTPPNGTGLPWAPATDGLRNLTGRVNPDGTDTIWAVTSTVSGNGDQGADPNKLVSVTDDPTATTLLAAEKFNVVDSAGYGEVLRGVSFTPGAGS